MTEIPVPPKILILSKRSKMSEKRTEDGVVLLRFNSNVLPPGTYSVRNHKLVLNCSSPVIPD